MQTVEFWIYNKNPRADRPCETTMQIHVGTCARCQHGRRGERGQPTSGRWIGPFSTLEEAEATVDVADALAQYCGYCEPHVA